MRLLIQMSACIVDSYLSFSPFHTRQIYNYIMYSKYIVTHPLPAEHQVDKISCIRPHCLIHQLFTLPLSYPSVIHFAIVLSISYSLYHCFIHQLFTLPLSYPSVIHFAMVFFTYNVSVRDWFSLDIVYVCVCRIIAWLCCNDCSWHLFCQVSTIIKYWLHYLAQLTIVG